MTTNPYFLYDDTVKEQDLLNDLVVEGIQNFGQDVKYIPRTLQNFDELLGADDASAYDDAYTIEMKVKDILGFGGDKEFFSQFGDQVRDKLVFSVSKDRWLQEVGFKNGQAVPHEGDLIWYPMVKKLFSISYVDPREMFYQLGQVYTWELTCEVFEYSGETIDTGEEAIDDIAEGSTNDVDWALTDENGNILTDEDGNVLTVDDFSVPAVDPGAENDYLPPELVKITDFDVRLVDPYDFIQSQFEDKKVEATGSSYGSVNVQAVSMVTSISSGSARGSANVS